MHTIRACTLAVSLFGQSRDEPLILDQFEKVATSYYRAPDLKIGPKFLKEVLKKENLEHPWFKDQKRADVLDLMAAYIGDIGAGQPKVVRQYESTYADSTITGRRLIVRVLANCGDKETIKKINDWLADPGSADLRGELNDLKKHLEDPRRLGVRDRPAGTPHDLDLLWCNFFVTGEYAPISRLLDVLDLQDEKKNLIMKRVAAWSLESNLKQHERLVEIVRKHLEQRPEPSRKIIKELLAKQSKVGN